MEKSTLLSEKSWLGWEMSEMQASQSTQHPLFLWGWTRAVAGDRVQYGTWESFARNVLSPGTWG